jgi:hypothetical protein
MDAHPTAKPEVLPRLITGWTHHEVTPEDDRRSSGAAALSGYRNGCGAADEQQKPRSHGENAGAAALFKPLGSKAAWSVRRPA